MNDWKHCSDDKSYNLITKQHGADMAIVRIVNYVFFSQKLHHIYIKVDDTLVYSFLRLVFCDVIMLVN